MYICMYILQNLINLGILNYPTIAENNVLLDITLYSLTLQKINCSQSISSLKLKYLLYFQKQYILCRILLHEEWISYCIYLKTEVPSYGKCFDSPLQIHMISAVQEKVAICCEKNKVHVKTLAIVQSFWVLKCVICIMYRPDYLDVFGTGVKRQAGKKGSTACTSLGIFYLFQNQCCINHITSYFL
jgi:hypothetical protein